MTRTLSMLAALLVALAPAVAVAQARSAQVRPGVAPAAPRPGEEIKLDESTTLKAAALEARMSALLANFALLQRQAQDMQTEMNKMLEERKALVTDAARRVNVPVADPNEWALDNKGQRFVKVQRPPAPGQAPAR